MTNHEIIAADWQLRSATEGQLKGIIVPLKPSPVFKHNCWHWPIEKLLLPLDCYGNQCKEVYKKVPYQIGDTISFQNWQVYTIESVGIAQSIMLCPVVKSFAEQLGWSTPEIDDDQIIKAWEKTWNAQFPDYPLKPETFAIFMGLDR